MVNSLVNGINIQCVCETDCKLSQVCRVVNFNVTSPDTEITSVNGESNPLDVKYLRFFALHINFVPRKIEKFFSKVEVLEIASSHLQSIEQNDLKPFTGLKELDLRNNDLIMIKEGLLDFNRELRRVYFDGNKDLKFVDENIFKYLRKLELASFHKCHCIDMQANNRQNIYSQRLLEEELNMRCHSPKSVKHLFCNEEIEMLKERISELENQLTEQTTALEHTLAALESHNGNLDLATKNLLSTTKQLKSCVATNIEFEIDTETFEEISLICEDGENGSCKVVDLKVETKNSRIIESKGLSENLIETDKIKKLLIVRQKTLFLPENIAEIFSNLEELFVNSSGLFEIDSRMFTNMTSLKSLFLTRNKLFEIPGETFSDLKNLESLDLSVNNIESLEADIFKNLSMLRRLKLNNNKLSAIDFVIFKDLVNLKEMTLGNNKLEFISTNMVLPLAQFEIIDFSNNVCINMSYPGDTLELIECTIIDNCVAPIELNCIAEGQENHSQDNNFSCKAENLMVAYPKTKVAKLNSKEFNLNITSLFLIDQCTKFMPFQIAQVLPNLQEICVERSNLTSLMDHDFVGLMKLKKIVIRYNNLTSIYGEAFNNITQLEHLDLSFNNIRSLPTNAFKSLVNLKVIILSNNQMKRIMADILPQRNTVQVFNVHNNRLEFIESKILRYLKRAIKINFSGNICISLNFERNDPKSKTLAELSGETTINCSHED